MTNITPDHLARSAIVYVRQSSAYQVANNIESQRRQYGLVERGRQLGWTDVQVIDDDLGRSGAGTTRPGFEKLLAAICEGRVGAVLSIEASRLARNGRDWHTLLEFCGVVDTLIIDEDGVYDPRSPNDRLLLGMKGTMSEMELALFRQRSREAIQQKARRGEFLMTIAIGYVKTDNNRIEKDPDRRVRDGIDLVFKKFSEFQTVRQVLVWFHQGKVLLPAFVQCAGRQPIEWKVPGYHTLYHILTNPVYAGAYVFGRRSTRVAIKDGRKKVLRNFSRDPKNWSIFIKDHHDAYISWNQFERNQRLIANNANGKSYMGRGSIRRGEALLAGLLRCRRCGRKLLVHYNGIGEATTHNYYCRGAFTDLAKQCCITFGGIRVDRQVVAEVLERLQPLGIEAAIDALAAQDAEQSDRRRQLENALEAARYEASRAHRQYDAVDPENRLVASELERRWNEKLSGVQAIEEELARTLAKPAPQLSIGDRERLMALGTDLGRAWDSPGATAETKKKIIRILINEIIVDVSDTLDLVIHWQGGDHTELTVKKNKAGQNRWVTDENVVDLISALARQMPDMGIAAVLNRSGITTSHGHSWTRIRIRSLRQQKGIDAYREGERTERGEITLNEAAQLLSISQTTIRRMINANILPASQLCKGAPWIIRQTDLNSERVRREAVRRRERRPVSADELQTTFDL
jgi:excisionase family DNA binding protein